MTTTDVEAPVAPKEAIVTPTAEEPEDPTTGRIQVSAQRRRRFYVFVARRQFATKPEVNQIVITALGSAIASAIATAGELVEMGVGSVVDVKTFYAPINSQVQRNVARIAITVQRNPDWKPEEADQKKVPRPSAAAKQDDPPAAATETTATPAAATTNPSSSA